MSNLQNRDSFIFYRSFYEAIQDLPKENQLELYNAIAQYSLNFEEPTLNGFSKTIFKLIKPQLEANRQRYLNGKKPKSNQKGSKEEAKDKQEESKKEANKNENKNNNENKLTIQNENHFDEFWGAYEPLTTSIGSKVKAKKKYQEYLKEYNHDQILEATKSYIDFCKKNKQKTKMCYGFFDEHLESYINIKKPTDKKDILKKINEIVGDKELFTSTEQLSSNYKTVFLFLKNEDDKKKLRGLDESKKAKIKETLKEMLVDKELSLQLANFNII